MESVARSQHHEGAGPDSPGQGGAGGLHQGCATNSGRRCTHDLDIPRLDVLEATVWQISFTYPQEPPMLTQLLQNGDSCLRLEHDCTSHEDQQHLHRSSSCNLSSSTPMSGYAREWILAEEIATSYMWRPT